MKARHTPGPWQMIMNDCGDENSGLPLCVEAIGEDDDLTDEKVIVGYHHGFFDHERAGRMNMSDGEIIANARLVATAPRMFDYINEKAMMGDEEAKAIIEIITSPPEAMQTKFVG